MQWENSQGVAWVAVDWGTSNLRIWLMSKTNQVIAEHQSDKGMSSLKAPIEFEHVLLDCLGPFLNEAHPLPVFCCGMVGAKQGWQDAGYARVPHNPLKNQAPVEIRVQHKGLKVWVLPGLCQVEPFDVMRGEETQIAGVLCDNPDFTGVCCLPGTHSKWALIKAGNVESFSSYMTGELFALLSKQSVLKHSITDEHWSDEVFNHSVAQALNAPDQFLGELFSIRARDLLGDGTASYAKTRLSGLLIGLELSGTKAWWQDKAVMLVGSGALQSLYVKALQPLNCDLVLLDSTPMTLAGLTSAYNQKG